jgi:hypothetical protein
MSIMFKNRFLSILMLFICIIPCNAKKTDLSNTFKTPSDSAQISCYWYWISNNVSEEGVVKDLHAMKKAGITRAFIGNIGLSDTPYGKVRMLTDDWWKILHAALKTATELGIDIGIFNSPGWSQSGGPWVSETEAMRYLVSSQIRVTGQTKLQQKLEKPVEGFHDVKVIAYPVSAFDKKIINFSNSKITSNPNIDNLNLLFDDKVETSINYPANNVLEIDIKSDSVFLARHISITAAKATTNAKVEFYGKDKTGFRLLKSFNIDRFNVNLSVGFAPFAPVVETFEPFSSDEFKLVIKDFKPEQSLAEIQIGSGAYIERYAEKSFAKMHQTSQPFWEAYQWKKQPSAGQLETLVNPDNVVDISDKLKEDGTLVWDVPSGEWIVERIGVAPTGTKNSPAAPEATGFEVDKMSKKHIAMHFDGHIGEILKRIPAADRKSFKVVVQDSYEQGGQNYTDDFFERFEKEYGYSALPFLPVFSGRTVKSQDASDRFLWDMRRLVANLVASEYVGGMKEISNKHGLTVWLENYGHWGFPSESLLYGSYSDEISGEFWAEGDLGNIENRIASSCGHIYGKNRISAESFTAGGGNHFGRTPASIKQRGDRFFAEGINSSLLHVFISQPDDRLPGINAWFGTEIDRNNTWFSQMDVFTTYLKRVNFMLQQGKNIADVAYFIGEDAPKMTGKIDPALPRGYQFDYINNDVILNYMTVKDGYLYLPHGTKYKLLVLPKLETMTPELLAKIDQLILDGAAVYGNPPSRSPSYKNHAQSDSIVRALATGIWGNTNDLGKLVKKHGKGMIISGMDMQEALNMINCRPDCEIDPAIKVDYSHRQLSDTEIYFITNQSDAQKLEFTAKFRVKGKIPEIWSPVSGETRMLKGYEQNENYTKVPLVLHPNESAFIVFRKNATVQSTDDIKLNFPDREKFAEIKGPWLVHFQDTLRGVKKPVLFPELYDWSTSNNDTIKYYSGTAIYKCEFTVNNFSLKNDIYLNLNNVGSMAKVKLNGKQVGAIWTYPYELNVSQFMKQGKNALEIEVVNTWVNRLIGDLKLPENQRTTWTVHNLNGSRPLQASGLLGPVVLESAPR